jgi:hypothetical protein
VRKIDPALDSLSLLVFRLDDSREREAVLLALDGHGKPSGVRSCEERAGEIVVRLDEAITPPALVRHLVEIERSRISRYTGSDAVDLDDVSLARLVAEATLDPELDANRIIEHLVPELGTL